MFKLVASHQKERKMFGYENEYIVLRSFIQKSSILLRACVQVLTTFGTAMNCHSSE